jgi:hypothetical protein
MAYLYAIDINFKVLYKQSELIYHFILILKNKMQTYNYTIPFKLNLSHD